MVFYGTTRKNIFLECLKCKKKTTCLPRLIIEADAIENYFYANYHYTIYSTLPLLGQTILFVSL